MVPVLQEDVMDASRPQPATRALDVVRGGAVALAVLVTVKFVHLLVEADLDISQAPVAYLLPLAALVAGVGLAARRRRVGIWTIAVVSLVLLVVSVLAIVSRGTAQQNWADALLVFAGVPVAVAVLVATPKALRNR